MNGNSLASSSKLTLDLINTNIRNSEQIDIPATFIYCRSGRDGESALRFQKESEACIKAEKLIHELHAQKICKRGGVIGRWVNAGGDKVTNKVHNRSSRTYTFASPPPKLPPAIRKNNSDDVLFEFGSALNDDVIGALAEFGTKLESDCRSDAFDAPAIKKAKTWHKIPCMRSCPEIISDPAKKVRSVKSIGLSRRRNKTLAVLPFLNSELEALPVLSTSPALAQPNLDENEETCGTCSDSDSALNPRISSSRWCIESDFKRTLQDPSYIIIEDFDSNTQGFEPDSFAPNSTGIVNPDNKADHIHQASLQSPKYSESISRSIQNHDLLLETPSYLFECLFGSSIPLPPLIPPPEVLVSLRHMQPFPRPVFICKTEQWTELNTEARWGYWRIDLTFIRTAKDLKFVWDTLVKLAGPGKYGPLQIQLTLSAIRLNCQVREALKIRQILRAVLRSCKDAMGNSAVLLFFGDMNNVLVKA